MGPAATQPTKLLWSIPTDQEPVPSTLKPHSSEALLDEAQAPGQSARTTEEARPEQQGCCGRVAAWKEDGPASSGRRWGVFRGRAPARLESPRAGNKIYMPTWHPREKRGRLALGQEALGDLRKEHGRGDRARENEMKGRQTEQVPATTRRCVWRWTPTGERNTAPACDLKELTGLWKWREQFNKQM